MRHDKAPCWRDKPQRDTSPSRYCRVSINAVGGPNSKLEQVLRLPGHIKPAFGNGWHPLQQQKGTASGVDHGFSCGAMELQLQVNNDLLCRGVHTAAEFARAVSGLAVALPPPRAQDSRQNCLQASSASRTLMMRGFISSCRSFGRHFRSPQGPPCCTARALPPAQHTAARTPSPVPETPDKKPRKKQGA